MDPATLLFVTQILALAAQAAAAIPAIRNAWTQQNASSTAQQQAEITASLNQAQANLQLVVQHAQTALNGLPGAPGAPVA